MSPLNSTGRIDPPGEEPNRAAEVSFEIEPATRAIEEGWFTAIVRSPTASTGDMKRVGTIPAEQRRFTDSPVPRTTGRLFWNARHEKPGSTAGDWFGWVGGRPRIDASRGIQSFHQRIRDQQTGSVTVLTANRKANQKITDQSDSMLTASDTTSGAQITVAEHDLQIGTAQPSYGSDIISGLSNDSKHFVFLDDPNLSGTTNPTYSATTNSTQVVASNDRYFVGSITTPIEGSTDEFGSTGGFQVK